MPCHGRGWPLLGAEGWSVGAWLICWLVVGLLVGWMAGWVHLPPAVCGVLCCYMV